jgi:thiol:disulfide interchange protein DsbD
MVKIESCRRSAYLLTFVAFFLSMALNAPAQAPTLALDRSPVEARLAAEETSLQAGKPIVVALILSMDADWHVYWKNPGDSGLPTTLDWDLPPGFAAGPIQWPVPQRFVLDGLVTYGYAGQVVLMSQITPPERLQAGSVVNIRARAGWLACKVECVPGKATLELSLPVRAGIPAADSRWTGNFKETRSLLPLRGEPGAFSASVDSRQITLARTGVSLPKGAQVFFYPDAPGQVRISSTQEAMEEGAILRLRLERDPGAGPPRRLTGILVTTGSGGSQAVEVDVPVTAARGGALGFIPALLLAFIGGVILNLMPCVLPVISLKVISFVRQGGEQGKGSARHGLLFAVGVLVSFWIIAGVLVGLRAGGRLLGWGFQFQDPAVVVVAGVLFFLIGLNLFGVFEIGTMLTRLGGARRGMSGGAASFISGMFATAVATPCTAPFMGVALGYALTHSVGASFGVFTALALGMAAPYLALSVVPGLVSRLPKPGPWMETLRQVMAFPMMAAAIWMVSVAAALDGAAAVILLLSAMLAAGMGAWVWGRWGAFPRRRAVRAAAGSIAILLAVGGTAMAAGLLPAGPSIHGETARVDPAAPSWEPWSQARLDELRQQGTPVFIDFTAKWCLSCQVNEKVALESPAVRKGFEERGIAALRADWTDSNDAIARALAGFGRASVPLYVFYPRGGKEPVILPELLTPAIVLAAIGR